MFTQKFKTIFSSEKRQPANASAETTYNNLVNGLTHYTSLLSRRFSKLQLSTSSPLPTQNNSGKSQHSDSAAFNCIYTIANRAGEKARSIKPLSFASGHWSTFKTITVASVTSIMVVIFISQVRATQTDLNSPAHIQLQAQLDKAGLIDVLAKPSDSGNPTLIISGVVSTDAEKQQAKRIVSAFHTPVEKTDIQISSHLVDAIDEVLHQLGLENLTTNYAGGGGVIITGYVGAQNEWKEALSLLNQDFPNLKAIDDTNVTTLSVRLRKLNEYISKAGLQGKIETLINNQDVIIQGALDLAEMNVWKTAANQFRRQYGSHPRLVSNVTLIKPGQRPSLEISGTMVTANKRFLVTTSGAVYAEGQSLPDGSIIKHIEDKRIVLSRHDHDYVYQFFGQG